MSKKIVEYIYGNPDLTSKHVEVLQKYFKVNWQFAKEDHIYYIDPESGKAVCKPSFVFLDNDKYQFKLINVKTVKEYVNRLQKQETDLDRRDQQPTSRVQCSSSKITIASGHLEDRTIDFRRRSKAQIGKANLSF